MCLQGTLESPEEFGEGLAQAAQVMMGHTMGGSALTNTLITSSITHTVNFDDDFKKVMSYLLNNWILATEVDLSSSWTSNANFIKK